MTIQQLRELRAARAKEARKLLDDNTGEKWNKQVGEKVDALYAELDSLDEQIGRHERLLNLEAGKKFDKIEVRDKDLDPMSPRALFRKWMRFGLEEMSAEERVAIKNTMSTTTGSQGGFTVETEVAKQIADALKGYAGMRSVSEIFQTQMGNDMNFPTSDGTGEQGELIGQNTTATGLDPSFGSVTISAYKYSSKVIAVPIELLQDSNVDMEAFIAKRIRDRLGRIQNNHFTVGTGSSQPNGIVTAATSGKVGISGQTLTVIYDDLADMIEAIDYAYEGSNNCRWMMAQSSRKVVRKLKDTAGRPLWMPSYDGGIARGIPETLVGYPLQINNDVPVMAANAKSILFGDFQYYKIRDVMDLTLFRFTDSAYTKLGQVGFLAWMRSGGNYVDVGGAVKYYQNSAT